MALALGACSWGEEQGGGQDAAARRDPGPVELAVARLRTPPPGPTKPLKGTFKAAEPCLFFEDIARNRQPVGFAMDVRWDPRKKGLVTSHGSAGGKDIIYRPGEWITIEAWEVSSESLTGQWATPAQSCPGGPMLIARSITRNLPVSGKAVREDAAEGQ
ncbi:MAG TPA: hypothetical protein VEZ70_02600 [Allosphingosinicella sp.]|nr:hypothetical protein [Allosphingosinicella sp.]